VWQGTRPSPDITFILSAVVEIPPFLKSANFWNVTSCSAVKNFTEISEEHFDSIFGVEVKSKQPLRLLLVAAYLMLGLRFDPEDGESMLLRNVDNFFQITRVTIPEGVFIVNVLRTSNPISVTFIFIPCYIINTWFSYPNPLYLTNDTETVDHYL
jgi:hypothetical protein